MELLERLPLRPPRLLPLRLLLLLSLSQQRAPIQTLATCKIHCTYAVSQIHEPCIQYSHLQRDLPLH
jgi:hypothetical protein